MLSGPQESVSIPKDSPLATPGLIHRQGQNVIDFAWAADPDYVSSYVDVDGVTLRLIHPNWTGFGQQLASTGDVRKQGHDLHQQRHCSLRLP